MSWKLRVIENGRGDEVGDVCTIPLDAWDDWEDELSDEFKASGRDFIYLITMPGGWPFSPDHAASESGSGWTVTGELPDLTITPSINAHDTYHGFITNGVIGDDLEGRTFLSDEDADAIDRAMGVKP